MFLKILQNSQENTCARISLMQAWPEILAEVFSCQFCKISKSTFFTEHIWATTSDSKRKKLKTGVRAQLDLAKARLDLLMKASKHVNSSCSPSNVGVVYADINCRLKTYLSNNRESFLSQWMIWFWKRKISCFLIQPWYSWVFALKWYFCQKCRWKRFYRDVVPHVLTGSLRNVFFFGGGGEGGGGGGKVNRVFNSVWKASLRYLH